jgi:hypothetical protein
MGHMQKSEQHGPYEKIKTQTLKLLPTCPKNVGKGTGLALVGSHILP